MRLVAAPLAVLVSMTGVLTVPAPAAAAAATDPHPAPTGVVLHRVPGTSVRAAEPPLELGSTRTMTSGFSVVAVTWTGTASPHVEVRTRSAGHWSRWHTLDPMADQGDPTTRAAPPAVHGTEPLWVGSADGVRTRVDADGARDLRLVLIDPGPSTSGPVTAARHRSVARPEKAPRPPCSRGTGGGPTRSGVGTRPTLQPHHPAGAHPPHRDRQRLPPTRRRRPSCGGSTATTRTTLGWSDIGYNFLVDRFGRAWVGRAGGGPARPVRGAHTLGFNNTSVGISVIGNFEEKEPTKDALTTWCSWPRGSSTATTATPDGTAIVNSRGQRPLPRGRARRGCR